MSTPLPTSLDIFFLQGTSLDEVFLVCGYVPGDPRDDEMYRWYLVHILRGTASVLLSGTGRVRGLWVSPTKTVYLTAPNGRSVGLSIGYPGASGYTWKEEESVGTPSTYPENVWGLSDEFVMAWGGGVLDAAQYPNPATRPSIDEPYCWLKNGTEWTKYPSPGWLSQIHGQDKTSLYAVGQAGLTARWHGTAWEQLASAEAQITYLQVTPDHSVYGTSSFGDLLRYSDMSGWTPFVPDIGYITGFVSWEGVLYLLLEWGLHKVEGNELQLVHEILRPKHLVAGKGLIWSDQQGIHEWTPSGIRSIPLAEIINALPDMIS